MGPSFNQLTIDFDHFPCCSAFMMADQTLFVTAAIWFRRDSLLQLDSVQQKKIQYSQEKVRIPITYNLIGSKYSTLDTLSNHNILHAYIPTFAIYCESLPLTVKGGLSMMLHASMLVT